MTQPDRQLATWIVLLTNIGMLTVLVSVALPLFHTALSAVKWIMAAGALLHLAGRILSMKYFKTLGLRQRRLHHMEIWAALFFVASAAVIFFHWGGPTDWIAFTLAGGVLLVYTSLMLPRAARKDKTN